MRAIWLESHDHFEGVGAHELNRRYDHCDDVQADFEAFDRNMTPNPVDLPSLSRAQSLLSSAVTTGRLDGADTSHYQVTQGGMNLRAARQAGLTWWAHKVSQSVAYTDPTWPAVSASMLSQGFTHALGYHWLSSTTDPERQADWFLRVMGEAIYSVAAMGDCEEQLLFPEMCLAFYERIEAKSRKPCVHYTGAYVGGGRIFADERIRQSEYGPRPVILAAYVTRQRMLGLPHVREMGIHGWQWSSNGPVPGVVGRCDMDEVLDPDAFTLACRGHVTPVGAVIEALAPPEYAPPVSFSPDEHMMKGGAMYSIIADSTNPSDKRWAWNGIVKIDLSYDKFIDFLQAGLLVAGHDDLKSPYMMSTDTLNAYPTI
jgi:GH25 family lysozyme M1 (1,4-beta-N-acetylmuramidase)